MFAFYARAQTWGVGYGLNSASEWQDVAITACKAALLVAILDLLRLSKNSSWFEVRFLESNVLHRFF